MTNSLYGHLSGGCRKQTKISTPYYVPCPGGTRGKKIAGDEGLAESPVSREKEHGAAGGSKKTAGGANTRKRKQVEWIEHREDQEAR